MRFPKFSAALLAAVAPVAVAGALAVSVAPASASTALVRPEASYGCVNNDGGYCGSLEFSAPAGQVFNVYHGGQGARGQKITEWALSDAVNTDFYAQNYNGLSGSGGPDKTFEYAPAGVRSGWCISFPSTAMGSGAVLRRCNEGIWQTFRPIYVDGTFVAWKNLASGYVITDPNYDSNGAGQLTQTVYTGSENQQAEWVS